MILPKTSRGLRLALPLLALTPFVGCATAPVSSATAPATNPCRVLPVKQYSHADNQALADEMDAANPSAIWPGVVSDYIALRDAVRACQSHN